VTAAVEGESAEKAKKRPEALLRVDQVQKYFPIYGSGLLRRKVGDVQAVESVSFDVIPGETLGVVGESGCGKSTAGRTVLKLLDPTGGKIEFEGRDITKLTRKQMVPLRREMQMIFQDPYSSLNPRHTVGAIISAPFKVQGVKPPKGVQSEVRDLMARVGLNPEHYNRYPNEFSGGQRQRIGIARAIALRPKLIVCDEPVSALDVSIQAQVVNLLEDLQDEFRLAYVFIAHDLSVVRHISDRIAVMYLGRIMELADADHIYTGPLHPYTHALTSAVPLPDPRAERKRERILLEGDLPSPINPPSGCVFRTRCPKAQAVCAEEVPPLRELRPMHFAACHFPEEKNLLAAV
jgi:peptide/nickel transport system ATP-binding protein